MKNKVYIIIFILLCAQVLLFYKTMQLGNGDYTGFIIMTVLLCILSFLFFKGYSWARWVMIGFLLMMAIVSLVAAVQHNDYAFYMIALLQGFVLYLVFVSKGAKTNRKTDLT